MERLALLLAAAMAAVGCTASEPIAPPLACVSRDACGCGVVVQKLGCPAGGVHFFHELADGAPLQFSAGQGPVTAASTRPGSNVFSFGPGEAWAETYRYRDGAVEIRYTPGASTCPKLPQDEACEYFDVRARVTVTGPQGRHEYSGTGTCGC